MIETERLILREFCLNDREYLRELLGDPTTMAHWPQPLSAGAVDEWLARSLAAYEAYGYGRWLVTDRESCEPLGDVGILRMVVAGRLENDLGYIIHAPHWGRGLALEAAAAALEWAFEHGLASVVASMATDNTPSVRVAEKLKMVREQSFSNPGNGGKHTYLYRCENRG